MVRDCRWSPPPRSLARPPQKICEVIQVEGKSGRLWFRGVNIRESSGGKLVNGGLREYLTMRQPPFHLLSPTVSTQAETTVIYSSELQLVPSSTLARPPQKICEVRQVLPIGGEIREAVVSRGEEKRVLGRETC
jgi:hypothetical protein